MPFDLVRLLVMDRSPKCSDRRLVCPIGWKCKFETGAEDNVSGLKSFRYSHKASGLEVTGCMWTVDRIRVNMARLLHGGFHGGVLDATAIQQAFNELTRLLDEISDRRDATQPDRFKFTYVEWGWNLQMAYEDIEPRLLNIRHPWIRRTVGITAGERVSLPGENFSLKVYNKSKVLKRCREVKGECPDVTRIEIMLKGRKLYRVTGWKNYRLPPTFDECWELLLSCVEKLQFQAMKTRKTSSKQSPLAEFCAQALCDGYRPQSMNALDYVLRGASASTRYRLRKEVEAIQFELKPWSLLSFLRGMESTPVKLLPASFSGVQN